MANTHKVKMVIPTDETIAVMKDAGIDVEDFLIRTFAYNLHNELHPDEGKKIWAEITDTQVKSLAEYGVNVELQMVNEVREELHRYLTKGK